MHSRGIDGAGREEAAAALSRDGIGVSIVDARFVKPLDAELVLELAVRTTRS